MIDRYSIAKEAREWIGTRWHHQASLKGVGTDCIGLVVGVAAACGIAEAASFRATPEYRNYGREPDPKMLLDGCDRWLMRISMWDVRLADILVFRFAKEPQHFALVSKENPQYIIHAYAQVRKVVENRLDDVWSSRVVRAYRFRGLAF